MHRFFIFRRGRYWYVQFYNEHCKKWDTAKSTKQTDENEARLVADKWRREGIPQVYGKSRPLKEVEAVSSIIHSIKNNPITSQDVEKIVEALKERDLIEAAVVKKGQGSEQLCSWLISFWNYDTSPYVKEKLEYGHSIGRRHCYDMGLHVKNYWQSYFKDKRLCETTKTDLKAFSLWLSDHESLKAKSINNILNAGTVVFRWAFNNELIPSNPAAGLIKFSGKARKRGILSRKEAKKLFSLKWYDIRSYLGNKLASCSGLRAGEILGLQVRDIGEDRLYIRHSFSNHDGLKSTKTGKERIVPFFMPTLRRQLFNLARRNPQGVSPTSFIFWSFVKSDRPMDFHHLNRGLKKMLLRLHLSEDQIKNNPEKVECVKNYWKRRNVVFHSWRHFFASEMANQLEQRKVMLATGHSQAEVFKVYADHASEEIIKEVGDTAFKTFGDIIGGVE
jgi:integrase